LLLQNDGNLVLYRARDSLVIWRTGTANLGVERATLEESGTFVLEIKGGKKRLVSPRSDFRSLLVVNDNGSINLVTQEILNFGEKQLRFNEILRWSSRTASQC
jgi:hypothetical protein